MTAASVTLQAGQAPAARNQAAAMSPQVRTQLMESLRRGAAYLRREQHADGTWEDHPGITAMAATAACSSPR